MRAAVVLVWTFEMSFSVPQWLSGIILDMLIKIVIVAPIGVAVTLGTVPIAGFVCLAVVLSIFHFVCLFFGCTFVVAFELVHLRLPRSLQFVLALLVTNVLFVAGFVGFFSLSEISNNIGDTIWN